MSFETPAALWGLASLALLVLFSLWRQAAVRTTVPSIALWKRIPERNPPIRALRRPRWRVELLLQALALAAIVGALGGPFMASDRPRPRKVALVFDTSARMLAGGRMDRAKAEARRLAASLDAGDEVVVYAAVPSPRRGLSIDEVRAVHEHVDPAPLLAAAREEAEHVVFFSDRLPDAAPEGVHFGLVGGEGGNVGLVEFSATASEVFARVVNHGPARRVPLHLEWADQKRESEIDLPANGERAWNLRGDFSGASAVRLALSAGDHFSLDDAATAVRLSAPRGRVSLVGRQVPLLVRALHSAAPGLAVGEGVGRPLLSIGVESPPGPADLRVWIRPPAVPLASSAVTVARHPLMEGVQAQDLASTRLGVVDAPEGAERLVFADGKVVAALWDGMLQMAVDPAPTDWPSTPSFPIFWTNVVDFARRSAASLAVVRTGRPHPLPGDLVQVTPRTAGALFEVSGAGMLVAHSVGEFQVRTRSGDAVLTTSLLDARESDTEGVGRALDWAPGDPAARIPRRRPLAGWLAGVALILAAAAWVLERRPE
jgi:hypothetical protein